MRASTLLVAGLAASCTPQLNAEWCQIHRTDQDCINAGLVRIDAAAPCPERACPADQVCDVPRGVCVECLPGGANPAGCHCGTDYSCHQCLTGADCASHVCLSDLTCAGGSGDILYATPNGAGTTCTAADKCTLARALSLVTSTKDLIELDAGTYSEGPLTLTTSVTLLGPVPPAGHQYQGPSDPSGRAIIVGAGAGPVITVMGGAVVGLYEVTVAQSPNASGVRCDHATLLVDHSVIRDNPQEGITASTCGLTISRSIFTANGTTGTDFEAIFVDNSSPIAIRNNFIFGNGNTSSTKGAVHFHGTTAGDFRFNSVAYNHADSGNGGVGGVFCESTMMILRDDIIDLNDGNDFGAPSSDFTGPLSPGYKARAPGVIAASAQCQPDNSYVTGPNDPRFQAPDDLHLTLASPSVLINNSNSDCSTSGGFDIDFDTRPGTASVYCDLGADEAQ